jgi:hypothetical protein
MDQIRFVESAYQIQHRHSDGSWGVMEEDTAAEHDPERSWLRGRIFRCRTCDESVTIVPGSEGIPPRSSSVIGGSAAETAREVVEDG